MAIEAGHRPTLDELPAIAAALADSPKEILLAFDRDGRFLLHAVGSGHQVGLAKSALRSLEGAVLIHNHPRGTPPSAVDYDTARRYRLRLHYVVARVEGVVSLAEIGQDAIQRWVRFGDRSISEAHWRPLEPAPPPAWAASAGSAVAEAAHGLLGAWL
ncbi:MAG TPA: hypothetical protein VMS86_11635 [Thermoanaerobaculia bacterium]|nr:hypothetical protein [Thermoanaerobaculia bacterium]